MITVGSLFSGIGGLEVGLEWSGLGPVVWQVESDAFCRDVLERHWPDAERWDDVVRVGASELAPVDVICGGFPCQDVSSAGKRAGLAGKRSGLWHQYARIVSEMRPEWVVVENVASGAVRWLDAVVRELERIGYDVLPVPLSAADVGAPHLRRRIFLVGRARGRHPHAEAEPATPSSALWPADMPEPTVTGFDVTPRGLKRSGLQRFPFRTRQLKALGNAVVPQCAEVVGWVIRELSGTAPREATCIAQQRAQDMLELAGQCRISALTSPFVVTCASWRSTSMGTYRRRAPQWMASLLPDEATGKLPTPTTRDNMLSPYMRRWALHDRLQKLLPTPTAQRYGTQQGGGAGRTGDVRMTLTLAAKGLLPTPTVNDSKNAVGVSQMERRSPGLGAMGKLNPRFVEWMMGFPQGWTETRVTVTARSSRAPEALPYARAHADEEADQ